MFSISKSIQSLCLSSLMLVPLTAKSDIFVLKDGTRLKGKITSQTYEFYTLKVEIVENVLGEKKVAVKDVVEIIKDDKSLLAYQRIQKLFPTGDFLTVDDYNSIKKDYIIDFYTKHPKSKYTKKVEKLQKQLDAEHTAITNGGVKIDGELFSKEQVDGNKYEIDAIIHLRSMENDIKLKKYIFAFRTFEILERDFQNTLPFTKALQIMQSTLPQFITEVNELASNVGSEIAKRQHHIDGLKPSDKFRISQLLKAEDEKYQVSLIDAEDNLKTKWLPLSKYEAAPIKAVIKHANNTQKNLNKLSSKQYEDGGKIYREILVALKNQNYDEGTKALSSFQKLRPPSQYIDSLKVAVLKIKDEAAAEKEKAKQELKRMKKIKAMEAADMKQAEKRKLMEMKEKEMKEKEMKDK